VILYFGNDWSADNRTSSHLIARRLMRDHQVIYVECPGLRAPKGNQRDLAKIFSKLGKIFKGPQSVDGRSYVYTLFQFPFHRFAVMRALNRTLMAWQIRWLCRTFKIKDPILWFVVPHPAPVIEKFRDIFKVYYCIDDYSALPGVDKMRIREMDRLMSEQCDLIFCASQPLVDSKKRFGDKVILSRHGVDFDHFQDIYLKKIEPAPEVRDLPRPVIGYFGLMEKWVDFEMIGYAAKRHPDWTFLMIGGMVVQEHPCRNLVNVRFIGSRPYEVLPSYAAVFDVGILPFVDNEQIYNSNPLKLRQYLAMGIPVVSTSYPEAAVFSEIIEIVKSKEEFVAAIEKVLSQDSPEQARKRIETVRPMSWENRYQDVMTTVTHHYQNKRPSHG